MTSKVLLKLILAVAQAAKVNPYRVAQLLKENNSKGYARDIYEGLL